MQTVSPKSAYSGLKQMYDRGAARYDEHRYESAEGRFFNDFEGKLLRDWLGLTAESLVLDMPAGTGRLCVSLAETGATVVGVDISTGMLREAAAKRTANNIGRIHLMQGSGANMPFPDDCFDAAVSFKFFHLVPDELKPQIIREMTRVLKPGRPLIVEFNSPYYGGILAFLRYYFRKKHPGGMRKKCIFPDQIPVLFEGLEVTRKQGVKLPFSGALARVFGHNLVGAVNLWFGKIPGLRYLTYAIIIEARKPTRSTRHEQLVPSAS